MCSSAPGSDIDCLAAKLPRKEKGTPGGPHFSTKLSCLFNFMQVCVVYIHRTFLSETCLCASFCLLCSCYITNLMLYMWVLFHLVLTFLEVQSRLALDSWQAANSISVGIGVYHYMFTICIAK